MRKVSFMVTDDVWENKVVAYANANSRSYARQAVAGIRYDIHAVTVEEIKEKVKSVKEESLL